MADELEGARTFSELQLGVRELFRILVPGGFALSLVYVLAPNSKLFAPFLSTTLSQVILILFSGLIAYALQAHELWWPYSGTFERWREQLNRAIVEVAGGEETTDYVNAYKFFLETKALDLRSRVHYFSSFYYMLTELSLASALAAVALFLVALTDGFLLFFPTMSRAPIGTKSASVLVVAALVVQMVLMILLTRSRGRRADVARRGKAHHVNRGRLMLSWAALLPSGLTALALVVLVCEHVTWKRTDLIGAAASDYRGWALLALAVAFGLLGERQWRSIISEQIFLVHNRRKEMAAIVEPLR